MENNRCPQCLTQGDGHRASCIYYGTTTPPEVYRSEPLKVALPLGIGDVHWAATKFRALSEHHGGRPIHAYINKSRNHATIGYLEILPTVAKAELSERAPFAISKELPPHHRFPRWSSLKGSAGWQGFDYVLVANGHLERGLLLDTYLPELGPDSTDWSYSLNISSEDRLRAEHLVGSDRKPVLLYLSGMGPNVGFHNHKWRVEDWVAVVVLLNAAGIVPMLVGADTKDDLEYMQWFVRVAGGSHFRNAVGQTTIPQYCALIEQAACWVGLNSGGGIVSAMRGTPTVMLWSDSKFPIIGCEENALHTNMKTSWLHQSQLSVYRALSLGAPDLTPRNLVAATLEVMRT